MQLQNVSPLRGNTALYHQIKIHFLFAEILASRQKGSIREYHIKWEGYQETTWEPEKNIPSYIRTYYDSTGNSKIPVPKVKEARKSGSTVQYELVWSEDKNLPDWDPERHVLLDPVPLPVNPERRQCNTRKDRDRRQNRHTCGIFIG